MHCELVETCLKCALCAKLNVVLIDPSLSENKGPVCVFRGLFELSFLDSVCLCLSEQQDCRSVT